MEPVVLFATLGSKAQIITLACDCLRQQGVILEEVVIIHTWKERPETARALARLQDEQSRNPDIPTYRYLELIHQAQALRDVTSSEEMNAAFRILYNEVRDAKLNNRNVHLLIAGGRRTLTVFGMAVAQMLFDDNDRLWHLASHADLVASALLHAGPGEWARLIHIPVIPWGRLSPAFDILNRVDDPFEAVEKLNALRLHEQWDAARIFILSRLSPAENAVIELLVREGLGQAEIAEQLHLSPRTVEQHLRSAYRKASEHWELEHVNQAQLTRLLGLYLSTSSSNEVIQNTGNPE